MKKFTFLYTTLCIIMAWSCSVSGTTNVDISECSQPQNSTLNNTIYRSNLRSVLNSLVINTPLQGGFFNTSSGNSSDRVYGLASCRADVSPITCSSCLSDFISIPFRECPESKDGAIWSSYCSLRFSNESLFGQRYNRSSSSSYGNSGLDDVDVFRRGFEMMETLVRNISDGPMMFATDVIGVGRSGERYGLGQCSRDLRQSDCVDCLEDLLTSYRGYVLNRTGWEMLGASCGLWYDDYAFYDRDSGSNPTPPSTSGCGERWYKGNVLTVFLANVMLLYWVL